MTAPTEPGTPSDSDAIEDQMSFRTREGCSRPVDICRAWLGWWRFGDQAGMVCVAFWAAFRLSWRHPNGLT
jgi:hypothetical protein